MGQVSRLQTRIITQPMATSGPVPKPNSSAPSRQAMATSRPLISLPSASMRTRLRRPFIIRALVGLGHAQLPGQARVVDGVAGRRAGAAVKAGDQHHLGAGLGNAGGDGADPRLADQLHADPAAGGWRFSGHRSAGPGPRWSRCRGAAAERSGHAGGGVAGLGNPGVDLFRRAAGRPRRAWHPGPS